MIILRIGKPKKYTYQNIKGNPIRSKPILDYIKKLVIPPNYAGVKIFYEKSPKILYQGFDVKGRLQQIYSPAWNKKAAMKKYCNLLNFSKQLPRIQTAVKKQMVAKRHTKNKMISLILRIVSVCYFRIGNKKYQELHGSFGAMNIQKSHVFFKKTNGVEYMNFSFVGKKGVLNTCQVCDSVLIGEIKKILALRSKNETVFKWGPDKVPVKATDINDWLKAFDPTITSKAFRTYDANIFLIILLRGMAKPSSLAKNKRKKNLINVVKEVAEKIHNTPSICKKNYIMTSIMSMYLENPIKYQKAFMKENEEPRKAFIRYLSKYCKV